MVLELPKFTFGVGDRFAHQAGAQLAAFVETAMAGVEITPVWNKSNREHLIIGSEPASVRKAADEAIVAADWQGSYFVDADHINLETVDRFVSASDFYTIDVADAIGSDPGNEAVEAFVQAHPELIGEIVIEGIARPFETTREDIEKTFRQFGHAVKQAAGIYQHILAAKGEGNFATEVSMDETDEPQTPPELLVILVALADAKIPVQTVAPKFSGRFNKGVDYVGDLAQFEQEFADDLAVISHAVSHYALPKSLKLSVHSGSDKFSLYEPIRRCLAKFDAGLHIKTAGTTWLEEVIGLADSGGEGLTLAQEIYRQAFEKRAALCEPYATVIDIDEKKLPLPDVVDEWDSETYVAALRHDPNEGRYNPHLRQLLHVGFKVAAGMGERYLKALQDHKTTIAKNVTENLFDRHLKPLFLGS